MVVIFMIMICQILEAARVKFTQELSFQSKDKDISLAKVKYCITFS